MGEKSQKRNESHEASLVEAFIYRLGNILGGRKEVVATPAVELLAYTDMEMDRMEAEAEKEKARIWFNFVVQQLSQPAPFGGKEDSKLTQARADFIETFQPRPNHADGGSAQIFDWDEELMKRLRLRQGGG